MKRKYYLGILMGVLLLMLCPMAVSAASPTLPTKTYSSGTWKTQGDNKYYYYAGKKITGWAEIKGKIYYFNKDGSMKTQWLTYNKKRYYFEPKNRSGAMVTGFYTSADGAYYYFAPSGEAKRGTFKVGSNTYYGDSNYVLRTSQWSQVNGRHYYFTSKGARKYHWFAMAGRRYFCSLSAGKLSGWKTVSGEEYYFANGGYVLTNQWIDKGTQKCYVDESGKVIKKINKDDLTNKDYGEIIMVGDSRFHHTNYQYNIGDKNVVYVTKPGKGLAWFSGEEPGKSGFKMLEDEVKRAYSYSQTYGYGKTAIVLNLGVNDLRTADLTANGTTANAVAQKYIQYMNAKVLPLAQEYQCDLYYVSINPVDESNLSENSMRKMKDIERFNTRIKTVLSSTGFQYIDTCTYLWNHYSPSQIASVDGVHFDSLISRVIYNQIMICLKPKNS
ncbi:MAG: hypothetical protein Q4F24_10285 [Eubacteriales bacterium]|nr:hypothetical protein [Eubacteriales bacterium]